MGADQGGILALPVFEYILQQAYIQILLGNLKFS